MEQAQIALLHVCRYSNVLLISPVLYTQSKSKSSTFSSAPSPPSGVSVSQNGLNSLLVSWTLGEPAVTGYIISYQTQDGGHSGSVNENETATSTIITGLMTGATYSVTIVATSSTLPSTETTVPDITIGIATNSACGV